MNFVQEQLIMFYMMNKTTDKIKNRPEDNYCY